MENVTVIFDSSWPTLWIDDTEEMIMLNADLVAWDREEITVDEFKDMWGDFHPDGEWIVAIRPLSE